MSNSLILRRWRLAVAVVVGLLLVIVVAVPANATPVTAADIPPLGVPDRITLVVDDVAAVTAQLEEAVGARFEPAAASRAAVYLDEESEALDVDLLRSSSTGDNIVDVVQASPAIGPWEVNGVTGTVHLTYSVDDRQRYEAVLGGAGFARRASSDDFSIWEGIGGVTVHLSDTAASSEARGFAGIEQSDLGPVRSLTLAPCDRSDVKNQLTEALGLAWKTQIPMALPWQFADGHVEIVPQLIDASRDRSPHLTIETPEPAVSCTPDLTPWHIVYFAFDLHRAERRMQEAGMTFVGRAPLAIGYYRGLAGVPIYVVNEAFELAELIP